MVYFELISVTKRMLHDRAAHERHQAVELSPATIKASSLWMLPASVREEEATVALQPPK